GGKKLKEKEFDSQTEEHEDVSSATEVENTSFNDTTSSELNEQSEFQFAAETENEHDLTEELEAKEEEITTNSSNIVSLERKREQNNIDEGIKWLHKAIAAGDIESMSEIAYLYLSGTGIPKNIHEGRKWLERA